ncbi:hypothetical protein KZZ52_42260 [Dactylosporangium sp. AC04546]|nr:hypothetical protein [Dactylosporangium sp. AC04546]WVK80543.1 hypothetical protein KZZ52_42260 [Dactylosporangium sp. AC04546]
MVELTMRGRYRFLINRTDRSIGVSIVAGAILAPRAVIVTTTEGPL